MPPTDTPPRPVPGVRGEPSTAAQGVTEIIGSAGGSITFDGATVTIPSGALAGDVSIHLGIVDPSTLPDASSSRIVVTRVGAVYELLPHGIQFASPVTIELPYADADADGVVDGTTEPANGLDMLWYDPIVTSWGVLASETATVDPTRHVVMVQATHFSVWTLADHRLPPGPYTYQLLNMPSGSWYFQEDFEAALDFAFQVWDRRLGVRSFRRAAPGQTPDITFEFGSLYRYYTPAEIGTLPLHGVLAWTQYPPAGTTNPIHIIFDDLAGYNFAPSYPYAWEYSFRTIAMHEIGHAIGLGHINDAALPPLMNTQTPTGVELGSIYPLDIVELIGAYPLDYIVAKPIVILDRYSPHDYSNREYFSYFTVDAATASVEDWAVIEGHIQRDFAAVDVPITFEYSLQDLSGAWSAWAPAHTIVANPLTVTAMPDDGNQFLFFWDSAKDAIAPHQAARLRASPDGGEPDVIDVPRLPGHNLVFVTSAVVTGGALGGLDAADALCQSLASSAGLPGVFKAWLSDNTSSVADRFLHLPRVPYCRVDHYCIAEDWDGLVIGQQTYAPIDLTETGGPPPDSSPSGLGPWTDTLEDGTRATPKFGSDLSCSGWTNIFADSMWGSTQITAQWSAHSASSTDQPAPPQPPVAGGCSWQAPLFCFQQPLY